MGRRIEIGILYSRSGNYRLLSESCRSGAMTAIADVNADPAIPIEFVPVERDPQGNIDGYATGCADILANSGARHIIGCITSWSRKEVIPILERAGGTLWYACPYEGFEANEHVVYMHACPNQHLVPLLAHVVPRFGANGFLLGSNYIWGWETNRVARDLIADAGGKVLGERYLPLGEVDVSRLIAEIQATRPEFILNNLIGSSSYAFIAAYAELAERDPHFRPERCPILSCNLTECELPALNEAGNGHLSVGPYFHDISAADRQGVSAPSVMPASSFEAAAYASVRTLAEILARNPGAQWPDLPRAFAGTSFRTPLGDISIDPQTQHATLPVQIGRIEGTAFKTVTVTEGVAPDPYLSRYDRTETFGRPRLRVVS
ncbi:MAG: N-acetylmuramoyl-L-alanine amidase [Mesorhizobium sp.]|uniref:transporter substrate-binding protein n=1 Tax=unclassified Mesorhizobium TaxID=325217 RepID=UPI000FD4AE1C|nr:MULTISPECIES: transporter substrate-binding protein [unclassified Mesorhizobium]RUV88760.1 N-acetylmuramoyl-L-alanine amidase [Mesorhizobium sp. M5C.F.Ca.IN.020.14.1.1]RUV27744.1 N-acetylmuramoyl-L-alanine amidase [Mesorhizobium sp. M5C.F.Ca.IN.020.32.2.1]RWD48656.1 MAG: N-acetylmuramoyl-L-alanine amidase [Mesorhizobium sp.]RWE12805.1 MAG: N-acetylmuramoyl-L-alanine amidase [Mesorhizobium sp.]RWE60197.1 MAG: N-acetylmuramoyl-L-alanine amidase [Mesorhizobium sp.]